MAMAENPQKAPASSYIAAVTVARIRQWREKWGHGKFLVDELRLVLRDLEPLLDVANLAWKEYPGLKPTIRVTPKKENALDPFRGVEVYSLKMLSSSLGNPGVQFLSLVLTSECRLARERVIQEIHSLLSKLVDSELSPPTEPSTPVLTPARTFDKSSAGLNEPYLGTNRPVAPPKTGGQGAADYPPAPPQSSVLSQATVQTAGNPPPVKTVAQTPPAATLNPAAERPPPMAPEKPREPALASTRQTATPSFRGLTPTGGPVAFNPSLPASLNDWVGQGMMANRLFREIRRRTDFVAQIDRWRNDTSLSPTDVQYRFILAFLHQMNGLDVDGQFLFANFPMPGPCSIQEFEHLLEYGAAKGLNGIDPRLWGVVKGTFGFIRNWAANRLPQ